MYSILIVDDNASIRARLKLDLKKLNFTIYEAANNKEALDIASKKEVDVVLLDRMLMKENGTFEDGITTCMMIKSNPKIYKIPFIIIVSEKTDPEDIEKGYKEKVDYYIRKPYIAMEIVSIIEKHLATKNSDTKKLSYKNIVLDEKEDKVLVDFEEVKISPTEYILLEYFMNNVGKMLSKEDIKEEIWGNSENATDKAVENMIYRLRQKIEPLKECLEIVKGYGYKLIK